MQCYALSRLHAVVHLFNAQPCGAPALAEEAFMGRGGADTWRGDPEHAQRRVQGVFELRRPALDRRVEHLAAYSAGVMPTLYAAGRRMQQVNEASGVLRAWMS